VWKDIKITFVKGEFSSHEEYLLFDKSQPNIYASMAEVMTSIENKLDFISKTILQDYLVDTGICEIHQRIKDSYPTLDEIPKFRYSEEDCKKGLDKYTSLDLNSLKPCINRAIQEYEASEYFGPLMDSLKLVFLQKSAIDLAIKTVTVAEKLPKAVNVAKNAKLAPRNKTMRKTTAKPTSEPRVEESFSKMTRMNTEIKQSSHLKNKRNEDASCNDRIRFARERDLEELDSYEFEDDPSLRRFDSLVVSPRSNSKNPKPARRQERWNSTFSAGDQSFSSSKKLTKLKGIPKESKSRNQSSSKDRDLQKSESTSKPHQNDSEEDAGRGYSNSHHKAIERRVDEIMTRRKRKESILRDLKDRPEEKSWFRDACQCVTW
jgi:hypothetical protein